MSAWPTYLLYALPRTYLRVSGCVDEEWDWGTGRVRHTATTMEVALVTAADPRGRKPTLRLDETVWSKTTSAVRFTTDGRLDAVSFLSEGQRPEALKTLFTGLANGLTSVTGDGGGGNGKEPDKDDADTSSGGSGVDKEGEQSPAASAPAETVPDHAPEERPKENTDGAGHHAPAPDSGGTQDPTTDTGTTPQPVPTAADEAQHRAQGEKRAMDRRLGRYAQDYPTHARLRERAQSLAISLLDQRLDWLEAATFGADNGEQPLDIADRDKRTSELAKVLKALDDHFEAWREANERRVSGTQVQYDLDLWDLPWDYAQAPWHRAVGRAAIRRALRTALWAGDDGTAEQQAGTARQLRRNSQLSGGRPFYNSEDRRDTRDAVLATFDRFGVVVATRDLYVYGDDRNESGSHTDDFGEERLPAGTDGREGPAAVAVRVPRQIDLAVYRLATTPEGREVLALEALRQETVVDEASPYNALPLSASADAKHQLDLATHSTGAVASIALLDESERAAQVKAAGEAAEAIVKAAVAAVPTVVKTLSGPAGQVVDFVTGRSFDLYRGGTPYQDAIRGVTEDLPLDGVKTDDGARRRRLLDSVPLPGAEPDHAR